MAQPDEAKIVADVADSIAEAIVVIPVGAIALSVGGWWYVLATAVMWMLAGVAKAAFRIWRLRP